MLLTALLVVLTAACGGGADKTSEEIWYPCECPEFSAALAHPPGGVSWWPTDWEMGIDLGTIYASGSAAPDDTAEALGELRSLFGAHDWEATDDPNPLEPGSPALILRGPEGLDTRLDCIAIETDGQLLIHFTVDDPIRNYTGWDDRTYVRALDEQWPELHEADALRDERAASLYIEIISRF